MRKVLILIILGISILICFQIVTEGFSGNGFLSIPNYKTIESSSMQLDTLISKLKNINEIEYKSKKLELENAIKTYQDTKEEYEELEAIAKQNESLDMSLVDIYDIDFLWTIVGNYATEEGVSLKFDVVKSITSTINSDEYTMCDLKFTITGEYIALTDFIYDLEDDSRLGFEISNFDMHYAEEELQATFTVREIPINNENLTTFSTAKDATDVHGNVINMNNTAASTNTVN